MSPRRADQARVRPRPQLAANALFVLAIVHAWWGLRMLLGSDLLVAGSQLVSVGGLVLAAVAIPQGAKRSLAAGMGIAALATAARFFPIVATGFGPFAAATLGLTIGMALVAWGAARDGNASAIGLRGGGALMSLAYLGFVGAAAAFGGAPADMADLALRAVAAAMFALAVDAPALVRPQRLSREDAVRAP